MKSYVKMGLFSFLILLINTSLFAEAKLLRVGGEFKIKKIEKLKNTPTSPQQIFRLEFESTVNSDKYKFIYIETANFHKDLTENLKLRISAEVEESTQQKQKIEALQLLVFLPHKTYGVLPIWLLSTKANGQDLAGASYLEMHSPLSDFMVF